MTLNLHGAIVAGVAHAAAHEAALEAADPVDVDDSHLLPGRKLVRVGAPDTSDGSVGWAATGVADAPTKSLKVNSGGTFNVESMPCVISAATPTSSFEQPGLMWFDSAKGVWRMFQTIKSDALVAGSGVAGWHPVPSGLMLVNNATDSPIEVGRVVRLTTTARNVSKASGLKASNILGVTIHQIGAGEQGLVARVGYAEPVQVYCNGASVAVVAGDLLVTSGTSGVAQSVGPSPGGACDVHALGFLGMATGIPAGAFAMALGATGADALVQAVMLPSIGQGCHVTLAATPLASFTDSKSGTGSTVYTERDITGSLRSPKHVPHGVYVYFRVAVTTATNSDPTSATSSIAQGTAGLVEEAWAGSFQGRSNGIKMCESTTADILIPTRNDSANPSDYGPKYASKLTLTTGASAKVEHWIRGYVY